MDSSVQLTEEIILAARKQEPNAIKRILAYYDSYIDRQIRALPTDEQAHAKAYIQAQLLHQVTKFDPDQPMEVSTEDNDRA